MKISHWYYNTSIQLNNSLVQSEICNILIWLLNSVFCSLRMPLTQNFPLTDVNIMWIKLIIKLSIWTHYKIVCTVYNFHILPVGSLLFKYKNSGTIIFRPLGRYKGFYGVVTYFPLSTVDLCIPRKHLPTQWKMLLEYYI